MKVFLFNARGTFVEEHDLFTMVHENLRVRRGQRGMEYFKSFRSLAALPNLDQPLLLDPAQLTVELYAAWEELWSLELSALAVRSRRMEAMSTSRQLGRYAAETFGGYFAAPMHRLAMFAASTTLHCRVRVATHEALAVGTGRVPELRLIQGGAQKRRE